MGYGRHAARLIVRGGHTTAADTHYRYCVAEVWTLVDRADDPIHTVRVRVHVHAHLHLQVHVFAVPGKSNNPSTVIARVQDNVGM
uniref:Uncharacterized protein n=1 Tax=Setaria digitata TaxID=48799 RepID=A0A915PRR1_9BILA